MIGTSDKGKGEGVVPWGRDLPAYHPVKILKWSTANQVLKFSKTEIVFILDL